LKLSHFSTYFWLFRNLFVSDIIELLQIVQDKILEAQSCYLRKYIDPCPQCKSKSVKHGYKASDFHGVFNDHKVKVQRLKYPNKDCGWRSVPSVNSLLGTPFILIG
jgi:hypothetical protein